MISLFQVDNVPYVLVRPDRALFFPSVEIIRTKLTSNVSNDKLNDDIEANDENIVVLDLSCVAEMDYTAAKVIIKVFINYFSNLFMILIKYI